MLLGYGSSGLAYPVKGVCGGDGGQWEVASPSSRSTGCSSCCPSGVERVAAKAAPLRTRVRRDTTHQHQERAGQTTGSRHCRAGGNGPRLGGQRLVNFFLETTILCSLF